jgi:hypothetical protein
LKQTIENQFFPRNIATDGQARQQNNLTKFLRRKRKWLRRKCGIGDVDNLEEVQIPGPFGKTKHVF